MRARGAEFPLQRLGGIATLSKRFVDAIAGTGCRILDTRKTTPGLRRRGENGRCRGSGESSHGAFDAILIRTNHIAAAGGVRPRLSAPALPICQVKSK